MLRTVSAAVLGLGFVAVSSSPALALAPETLEAKIPFAFNVSNVTLPAGEYRINPVSDLDPQVVEIRSTDGRHAVVVLSEDAPVGPPRTKPELVFDRYGQQEFLRAIKLPEEPGASLGPSRSEIDAARAASSHRTTHKSANHGDK
jgi:hypothetical protein